MSAIGTKRTFLFAAHMSAFGGEADIALRHGRCTLGLIGRSRKRLREWLALGPTSDEGWKSNKIGAAHHPRERAAPISLNSPPSPEVGVATIPTRNCGQLVVTNTVRRQILELRCRDDTRAATVLPFQEQRACWIGGQGTEP